MKKIDLTFKMNHNMTSYFLYLTKLKEILDNLNKDCSVYEELEQEFKDYKEKFIKEFQKINAEEIAEYMRIKDEP